MTQDELKKLLEKLVALSKETEWVEFKHDNYSPDEIGEQISALSNSACLHNQKRGYLVFGVEDKTHNIVGTTFRPKFEKRGNEEIEHWLAQRLNPRIDFIIYEFEYNGKQIAVFEIPAASNQPVRFSNEAYIRVGTIKRNLIEFPEKEKKIWKKDPHSSFENEIALSNASADDVVRLLDCQSYFDLIKTPFPTTRTGIIEKFISEKLILDVGDGYSITKLGAILFAKKLTDFEVLARKAVRVIIYEGKNRVNTKKEQAGNRGYAVGFGGLINYINDQLPSNEEIGNAFRKTVRMYPEIAIRELVANALIHQDLSEQGVSPMVEIFSDRIEITNPGLPIITPMRFIDEYQSRNEKLASLMRRIGVCEEKGSGIDKVIFSIELFQLPAPDFIAMENHTKVVLYSYQKLKDMDRKDKIRACYQHCCLKYVSNEKMTNQTLRDRFKIEQQNYSIASRIIADTMDEQLIKYDDPENKSRKFAKYLPFWT
jgi:predicted HTH transcriptional regulator